jgi:hypothetical protein
VSTGPGERTFHSSTPVRTRIPLLWLGGWDTCIDLTSEVYRSLFLAMANLEYSKETSTLLLMRSIRACLSSLKQILFFKPQLNQSPFGQNSIQYNQSRPPLSDGQIPHLPSCPSMTIPHAAVHSKMGKSGPLTTHGFWHRTSRKLYSPLSYKTTALRGTECNWIWRFKEEFKLPF